MATRLRTDAAQLRAPRVKDDGTTVFDAVLVYADRPLEYSWGVEIPTAEALSSPAYLDSLRGQPVGIGNAHPEGGRIDDGRDGNGEAVRMVGTVVDARWDGVERCVIVGLAIHTTADAEEARRLGGVSEGYTATVENGRQIGRISNHVWIVPKGRAPGSGLRADGEDMADETAGMDLSEVKALLTEIKGILLGKGMGATAEIVADADPEAMAADEAAMAEKIEARADALAQQLVDLRRRADAARIEIPVSAKTVAAVRKAVALGMGADAKRVDSAEYATAWIEARATASDTDADRMARGAVRADSTSYAPTF